MLDTRVYARDQIVLPQVFEAGAPGPVHKVASIAEVSDATHVGILHMSIKHLCGVRIGKMAFGDDAMRATGFVGKSLKPLRLIDGVWNAERRLNMNRFRHVREADLGDIVFDPIVLRLESVYVAQEAVDGGRLEPRIAQLRTLHVMQVKVGVNQGYFGHRGVPSSRGCRCRSPCRPAPRRSLKT